MSKQKRGMFKRMVDAVRGKPVTHQYADPVLRAPEDRVKKPKRPAKGQASKRLPSGPGSITYHDKLVRHFGRRLADGYHECIRLGFLSNLPTEQDFIDNPPWDWRGKNITEICHSLRIPPPSKM